MTFEEFLLFEEDYTDQVTSGTIDGKEVKISVGKAIEFASKGNYLRTVRVSELAHDLEWWDKNKERMMNANTNFPLLVFELSDGHFTVADGLNRLKKAKDIEKKVFIRAYVVPFEDLPKEVFID